MKYKKMILRIFHLILNKLSKKEDFKIMKNILDKNIKNINKY